MKCKFIASSNSNALLWSVKYLHLVLFKMFKLDFNSALHSSRRASLPAILCSQMNIRHEDKSQAAGSSQDSEVFIFSKVKSLMVSPSIWLVMQARSGVVTSLLWEQEKRCSKESSSASQKTHDDDWIFPVLCKRSLVGRMFWRNLKRNDFCSGAKPKILESL